MTRPPTGPEEDPVSTPATLIDALRLTVPDVEAAICDREPEFYVDHSDWAEDCDGVSHAIVRSGLLPGARVARGQHRRLTSKHSWVPLADGSVLDATLWSYLTDVPVLHVTDGSAYTETDV